jgi:hypothetical protein
MKRRLLTLMALLLTPSLAMSQEDESDWLYFSRNQAREVWPIFQQLSQDVPGLEARSSGFLSHAIEDLDGDGENEILMRYSEAGACVHLACPIMVGRHDGDRWQRVGLFYTFRVKLGEVDESGHRTLWTAASVKRDGQVIPYAMAGGTYQIDLKHYGSSIDWSEGEDDFHDLVARDFPELSLIMRSGRAEGDRIMVGAADMNGDGSDDLVVRLQHASVCNSSGCPTIIYLDGVPIHQGRTLADTAFVLVDAESGMKSILAHGGDGAVSWQWSNESNSFEEAGL